MLGIGIGIFRRNSAATADSTVGLGDFLVKDDGCNLLTDDGACFVTSVDVDYLVNDTYGNFLTSSGDCLITYEL